MSASPPDTIKRDNVNPPTQESTPHHDQNEQTEHNLPSHLPANGITETVEEKEVKTENGDDDSSLSQRPLKRRKLDDLTRSSSRAISPPWKSVSAEGPTTVVVDGKRKSTRFIQPPPPDASKRATRGKASKAPQNATPKNGQRQTASRAVSSSGMTSKSKANQHTIRKTASATSLRSPSQRTRKSSDAGHAAPTMMNGSSPVAKRGPGRPRKDQQPSSPEYVSPKARRASYGTTLQQGYTPPTRAHRSSMAEPPSTGPTPRIKLLLRRPEPLMRHPQHAPPPKQHETFSEWLDNDDPLEGEDVQKLKEDQIHEEVDRRIRIVQAAEFGVLSQGRSSVYQPDAAEEPPPQYGHFDHVVAHVMNFGKLLKEEKLRHRRLAKRLAIEAVDKWKEKFKKKSQEEIEQEERDRNILRCKQTVKDVKDAWGLVKVEIDQERMAKWEEEQLQLGHKAMDSMFTQAQEILGRNMLETSSSFVSEDRDSEDESSDNGTATSEDEEVDENMSSSGSESEGENDVDEDANLTAEQLRAKYGQLPDVPAEESDNDEDERTETEEKAAASDVDSNEDRTPEPEADPDLQVEDDETIDLVRDREPMRQDQDGDRQDEDGHQLNGVDHAPEALINGLHKSSQPEDGEDEDARFIDPATIELEEVDDALMDSEADDEDGGSESGSEAWSDTEEASDDESDDDEAEAEESEDDNAGGVLGFLAPEEIKKMKEAARAALPIQGIPSAKVDGANGVNGYHDHSEAGEKDDGSAIPLHGANGDTGEAQAETKEVPNGTSHEVDEGEAPTQMDVGEQEEQDDLTAKRLSVSRSRHTSSPLHTEIPSLLRGTLREYQHEGLEWLVNLYDGETNGILADEMGLGKTIQTIALLAYLAVNRGVWGPHLIVVPTSVMLNWEMEFKKFCPGFKILTYYGTIEERQRKRKGWLNDDLYNVVITSYQLILQDASAFKRRGWHYLILDEAHNIKNFKTQRWQTLLNFRTERRLLLTGTPLQNNIDELWSLLYFLMPAGFAGEGRIAGLEEFTMALKNPTSQILEQGRQQLDAEAQKIVKRLHEVLRPYLLRRLKADVEKQMPAKYEHVVYCRLSKRQRQLYDGFMQRADTKATLASGNYMSIINCLMSLRKVCNHPDLFETRQIVTSFAMQKSVVADFEIKDLLVRKRLLESSEEEKVSLDSLHLLLVRHEQTSRLHARRSQQIRATRPLELLVERQTRRLTTEPDLDRSTLSSVLSYMAHQEEVSVLRHLQTCLRQTRQRTQFMPVYGKGLLDKLNLNLRKPRYRVECYSEHNDYPHWVGWQHSTFERPVSLTTTLEERSEFLEPIIQKFSCVTPAVVTNDLAPLVLSEPGVELIRQSPTSHSRDPFHEARIRLSIAFPDKRLLQFDCGKLQRLAVLLRDLQAGGHRALIFTQMTKVLDILEQFLNIYGHRYLRLDGATKVEQRQILTDRFNTDPRILCFILSSRSGGLGINLTGADTVIFYDLDWNPAMDKQCQDRSHRIGQTRDVHIYKFVSEYTIEANILRKSNQKRLLDDVIIQKGDFTTDYFNKITWRDAFADDDVPVDEAGAAMDRVLGDATGLGDVIQSVEDREDATAAKVAQKEIVDEIVVDEEDFKEGASKSQTPGGALSGAQSRARSEAGGEDGKDEGEKRHVDEYMLEVFRGEFGDEPWRPPRERDKKRGRKGQDPHRVRGRKRRG